MYIFHYFKNLPFCDQNQQTKQSIVAEIRILKSFKSSFFKFIKMYIKNNEIINTERIVTLFLMIDFFF